MSLKSRIEKVTGERGLTLKQLARDINMSESNLYRCFNKDSMQTKDLLKIAERLRVKVSYLLGESDNNSEQITKDVVDAKKYYQALEEIRELHNELREMKGKYKNSKDTN